MILSSPAEDSWEVANSPQRLHNWGHRNTDVGTPVISRKILLLLALSLVVLLVSLAVLIGGYGIAAAAQDAGAARALWWVAMSVLMLLVVDLALLVGALAIREIERPNGSDEE